MSKQATGANAAPATKVEATSTTDSTTDSTVKTSDTEQTKDSDSKPVEAGIIQEGLSEEEPKVDVPATEEVPEVKDDSKPLPMEPYELELSEESPLTDAEFDEIVQEAERLKLNKEDAEKLISMREYSHKASGEIFEEAAKVKVEAMVKSYREDATLHTPEAKLSLREAVKTFGNDPSFKEMFNDPAMNFNIPLAKFLITVGDKIRSNVETLPKSKGTNIGKESSDPLTQAANNFYKNM